MNFIEMVNAHGRTMPQGAPPIPVAHPIYGPLGVCTPEKGLVPPRGRWASTRAILRDSDRKTIQRLRWFEDHAPKFIIAAAVAALAKDPFALPVVMGAISNYDGIVSARGSGALQDVWMAMTASLTAVSTVWMDLMNFASWVPMTAPSYTAFVNSGTGGAVMDAASNGSWLTNPTGSNKKYVVSMGLTVTSVTGFALAMLYDALWGGSYSVVSNNNSMTPNPAVTVTRWANTTAGNADFAGGNMMQNTVYSASLTFSVAGTITVTYVDQGGTGSKTSIWIPSASGLLLPRIVGNTGHNSATVIPSTPFMPLTNSGSSGVRSITNITPAGMTCTIGTLYTKIVRPLLIMPFIAAASYIEQDSTLNIGNMVELHNVSQVCGCLGWNVLCGAGTAGASMSAFLRMVEG